MGYNSCILQLTPLKYTSQWFLAQSQLCNHPYNQCWTISITPRGEHGCINIHFPTLPATGSHQTTYCVRRFAHSGCFIQVESRIKQKWNSLVVSDSLRPLELYSPWNSPGQNTGVGSLSLLHRIFPIQESSQDLLHCRRILYQLSSQGSPESRASCLASCTSSVFARTGHVVALLEYFIFTNSQLIRHLSCSHFFTIVYNAAMSIPGQVFLRMYVFTSLRCVPRRGTAGSQGNPV